MADTQSGQKSRKPFFHYLPYSEEDEKPGMVCTSVGSVEVEPNVIYPPFKEEPLPSIPAPCSSCFRG